MEPFKIVFVQIVVGTWSLYTSPALRRNLRVMLHLIMRYKWNILLLVFVLSIGININPPCMKCCV